VKHSVISIASISTLIKVAAAGLLVAESWFFSQAFSHVIAESIHRIECDAIPLAVAAVGVIVVLAYLTVRDCANFARRLAVSFRFDIALTFCIGAAISIASHGIGHVQYAKLAAYATPTAVYSVLTVPFALAVALFLRYAIVRMRPLSDNSTSFFINDLEKRQKVDDLLGLSDQAERFAARVVNQRSPDSIVFGIDAPWGIGKSTFINFCIETWAKDYRDQVIVYDFKLLRFEDRTNLLELFIDGLVRLIRQHYFIPELRPVLSKYSRFIKGAKTKISALDIEFPSNSYTVDDALGDLEAALSTIDKQIIVVVDDLDRLTFSSVKDVLFAIKSSFMLPRISYVLCYETENLAALEGEKPHAGKLVEFLEKFVNLKISLYVDSGEMEKYVSSNLAIALSGNSQSDPILVSTAIGGLVDIYRSPDYHDYLPFVGDIRKVKRLINTVLLLEVEKTDFENSDFNKADLIHLLLIYVTYPNLFREIYNAETNGKNGFFSALGPMDAGYPTSEPPEGDHDFKSSRKYIDYLQSLSLAQQFLLNKLFDLKSRLGVTLTNRVAMDVRHSYACFNGGYGTSRNLEGYLQLIVKLSRPQKASQYQFYLNLKNGIARGDPIEDAFSRDEFAVSSGEHPREQLWRVLVNSSQDLNYAVGANLIRYLVQNIFHYSLLPSDQLALGLRDKLCYFLNQLLDTVGWGDPSGGHLVNSTENLAEIGEWIFGEGRHLNEGILAQLSAPSRGILGFFDLLGMRLSCSADRGGNTFQLQRALSARAGPNAPTSGLTSEIAKAEMREISQRVFEIFDAQYIQPGVNIFESVSRLTLSDLSGIYLSLVEQAVAAGKLQNVDTLIAATKSRVIAFSIYQLGNSIISSGVGCGYYDRSGDRDEHGIRTAVNEYLFDTCFLGNAGFEHFLDYLLLNLTDSFTSGDQRRFMPSLAQLTRVFEEPRLAQYWETNRAAIKALNFDQREKSVTAANYVAYYKDDLVGTYRVLDALVDGTENEDAP